MSHFKTCSNCGVTWPTQRAFLEDPSIELVGYQTAYLRGETGIFLFNHSCHGTLALAADQFADLYDGELLEPCAAHQGEQPPFCNAKNPAENPRGQLCSCHAAQAITEHLQLKMRALRATNPTS